MKKLVILGGGESGIGVAILGKKQGFEVFLSDKGSIAEKYAKQLRDNAIEFEEGKHSEARILLADEVIKSPGIPKKAELILKLKEKGVKVMSEIEFAARYTKAKLIALTGSNGKTTTASLVYHIFKEAGYNVGLAGNIGKSFALQVATENFDYYILEISSFQLDDIYDFKPHISLILNLSPDHLNEYDYKYENYIDAKFRILENQDENDVFIYNADDVEMKKWMNTHTINVSTLPFSLEKQLGEGAFMKDEELVIDIDEKETFNMKTDKLALQGKHNVANSMAAGLTAKVEKISNAYLRQSLQSFEAIEHRLEFVLKINNVSYINDSKATNVNSTYYALESMKTPTIWIVGGVDKGNDYTELLTLVQKKVKAIVCLGVDNTKIIEAFEPYVSNIVESKSMKDAVNLAYNMGEAGDTVLLSPASASFDLFKSYEDRGNQFKQEIKKL